MPPVELGILDLEFLKAHGIGTVSVLKIEGDDVRETRLKLQDNGKELRLLNFFPLDQMDFHVLFCHTNPLVGCTGDNSLTEAISFDLVPFYELREGKDKFWDGMIALAESVGNGQHYLKQYFLELKAIRPLKQEIYINLFKNFNNLPEGFKNQTLEDIIKAQPTLAARCKKIAALLSEPKLAEEVLEINALIRSQFNFNQILKDFLARELALKRYPDLKAIETKLAEQFSLDRKSLKEVSKLLDQRISQ